MTQKRQNELMNRKLGDSAEAEKLQGQFEELMGALDSTVQAQAAGPTPEEELAALKADAAKGGGVEGDAADADLTKAPDVLPTPGAGPTAVEKPTKNKKNFGGTTKGTGFGASKKTRKKTRARHNSSNRK